MLLSIYLVPFFLRAMKTSIDSLKLAVSWKGSQIPGAKFTVKVCVHSVLCLEGRDILCVIFVFHISSVPVNNLSFAKAEFYPASTFFSNIYLLFHSFLARRPTVGRM